MNKTEDRIAGAIVGGLVGDALGVGPHWYYDLDALQREYGAWISDYTEPKPSRYHAGLRAGQNSQTGQVFRFLLDSLVDNDGYNQADFTARLDGLLQKLDGRPASGRYTDQAMRDVWKARQQEARSWEEAGSFADTAEAAIRAPLTALRFFQDPEQAVVTTVAQTGLTHVDPFIRGQSVAFGLLVAAVARGGGLEAMPQPVLSWLKPVQGLLAVPDPCGGAPVKFFDALLQPGWSAAAATDPAIRIFPPQKACRLFGLACTLGFMLPAAYYFVARFAYDFENAVLSAVNGGGNNMARAALTGALSGAQCGLSQIPLRFIEGLEAGNAVADKARTVAEAATRGMKEV